MSKRSRGEGSLFLRGKTWWIAYRVGGKQVQESARSSSERAALQLLRRRLGEIGTGTFIGPDAEQVRFERLVELVRTHYQLRGRASTRRMENAVVHLTQAFGGMRALDITADRLAGYEANRRQKGAAMATAGYELAILRKAFRLAVDLSVLPRAPKFPTNNPDNARQGFFEAAELEAVLAELPDYLRPVIQFAAITGWRISSEVLRLTWDRVDPVAGVVRLEIRSTKNRDGRVFPVSANPRLEALLAAQRNYSDTMAVVVGHPIPWVFHHGGKPIRHFYHAWHAACKRAGVAGPIPHDLRRSVVRALERAGVSRSVSMQLTGHKTEAIYRRYAIVSESDLREGVAKLARLTTVQQQSTD